MTPQDPDVALRKALAAIRKHERDAAISHEKRRAQLVTAIEVGVSVSELADTAGVGRPTIYRWLKEAPRGTK